MQTRNLNSGCWRLPPDNLVGGKLWAGIIPSPTNLLFVAKSFDDEEIKQARAMAAMKSSHLTNGSSCMQYATIVALKDISVPIAQIY